MQFDSLQLRILHMNATQIAQYGEYFGLAYGEMVQLWENADELDAEFRDYPIEYTVLRLVCGSLPKMVYRGSDAADAALAYGQTVLEASARRKADRMH